MKKKNLAFTLAEVLIVIGIIGVVAALTLPNLNHATGDKETVTRVKKIYSTLNEAFDRAQAIYGDYDTWFENLSTPAERNERFAKRVTEFMKISKDCDNDVTKGCFTQSNIPMLYSSGNIADYSSSTNDYLVITADGMSISFLNAGSSSGSIIVDIDGPNKGAFVLGKDCFYFSINVDSNLIVTPTSGPGGSPLCMGVCTSNWIIDNDNVDYLKTDLNTRKCNDSNIILDGTTNTSCH